MDGIFSQGDISGHCKAYFDHVNVNQAATSLGLCDDLITRRHFPVVVVGIISRTSRVLKARQATLSSFQEQEGPLGYRPMIMQEVKRGEMDCTVP